MFNLLHRDVRDEMCSMFSYEVIYTEVFVCLYIMLFEWGSETSESLTVVTSNNKNMSKPRSKSFSTLIYKTIAEGTFKQTLQLVQD